jgi:hypothetical protein
VAGPNYGRVWNVEVVEMLIDKFGDGISGDWRVPGEFGKRVDVDRQDTTLGERRGCLAVGPFSRVRLQP